MENPFNWDYLTAPIGETPTWGPFSIFYVVLYGLTFLVCAFVYYDAPSRFSDHRIKRETARRIAEWMMWVTAIGLVFFGIRALRIEIITIEKRIWLYLSFVSYLGVAGYWVYYLRTTYRERIQAFERNRERRRYMPTTAKRPGAKRRRAAR